MNERTSLRDAACILGVKPQTVVQLAQEMLRA